MSYLNSPILTGRKIPFEFPSDISPCWIPEEHQLSSMFNGASLTMPYLEPFLIKTIREAGKSVENPALKKDIAGFASQEGHHFRTHRQFNDLLIENHYPELAQLEQKMQRSYQRLNKRSLQTRMAYTAGFEAMTMGVTKWIIGDRIKLFHKANPHVCSFILWHMVEETEHKCVAYDVYHHLYGTGFRAYCRRALGVFHGSFDVMRYSRQGYLAMLKKDGLRWSIRSRLKLYSHISQFLLKVSPFLLRAALPGHNPRDETDLQWVLDWLKGYQQDPSQVPLVDTDDPKMPVPFPDLNSKAAGLQA